MSILKNFQYTQVDKNKYLEALKSLKEGNEIDSKSFFSIAYNLNKIENPEMIIELMLKSSVQESDKKKLIRLLSMKQVVTLLKKEKSFVKYFMYPNILPTGLILLVISLFLKPYGILIILGYIVSTIQLRKILNKKVLKELT